MKKPKDLALIAIGQYNMRNRTMTCQVYNSNTGKTIWSHNLFGGSLEIAHFLAACKAFQILDESIETENEFSVVYIPDWNTLREVRAANCVSGLYVELPNFEEIIEHLEDGMDFLDLLGLKFLKERSQMWDKYSLGNVEDYLAEKENL